MATDELNILFTCAGRRVAMMNKFRRAMAELGVQGKILATDLTFASAGFQAADVGLEAPPVSDTAYLPWLRKVVAKHRVGLIIPVTDLDLMMLAWRREEFLAAGCEVMVGHEKAVSLCRDKLATAGLIERIGLPVIRSLSLEEFLGAPFFPCFVKPVSGSASVGAKAISSEEALRTHVETFGNDLLVQDFISGPEYTIDVYRAKSGECLAIVPRQRLAVRSGEVEKGITVGDDDLIDAARRISDALDGMWGVFCCQCRRGPEGKARFFEINPRFGGGAPLSIASGADLPRYLLEEVLGRETSARPGTFTRNLLMVRYDEAAFVTIDDASSLSMDEPPTFR